MIEFIPYIIIGFFLIGAILMVIINRGKSIKNKKENWLKYTTYFLIVNLIIGTISYLPHYFYWIACIIATIGFIEIVKNIYNSNKVRVGLMSLLIYIPLIWSFLIFARSEQRILLYTYLIVSLFDAFSQLSGQLFGKRKLVPKISPGKTVEGLIGGFVIACLTSVLFSGIAEISVTKSIVLSFVISIFAFTGDIIASLCKRRFEIKDFSNLLPGQGGFLDRFDSLIFSSILIVALNHYNCL
jgi:phosphatidate cytidylyltransferase